MDFLSMAYLARFRFVQITRNPESYSVWVVHEMHEHFVAEQLRTCLDESAQEGCLEVASLVFPCCTLAPTNVDGELAFPQARLKSRSVSAFEGSTFTACYPSQQSPFFSTCLRTRNCDTQIQLHAQSVPTAESQPTNRAPELPLENTSAILHRQNKKRKKSNQTSQKEHEKGSRVTVTKAALLLMKQFSTSANQATSDQRALPDDADIIDKLKEYQQLVISKPENVDDIVKEFQLWLQQVQQRSSLYLAALQHLLTCVDLYNWVNRHDKNTERSYNKERWSGLQMARYRNMLANELCKSKDGMSDCLGLTTLAPMTAKGLKFGHLQRVSEKDKLEIIRKFAELARPKLEEGLRDVRFLEVTNPVSFVSWFLEKPAEELANICEALCFTELSVENCSSSPTISYRIPMPETIRIFEGGVTDSDGTAQGFHWLLKAADRCDETTQYNYEVAVTDPTHFDSDVWGISTILDPIAQPLGFS